MPPTVAFFSTLCGSVWGKAETADNMSRIVLMRIGKTPLPDIRYVTTGRDHSKMLGPRMNANEHESDSGGHFFVLGEIEAGFFGDSSLKKAQAAAFLALDFGARINEIVRGRVVR